MVSKLGTDGFSVGNHRFLHWKPVVPQGETTGSRQGFQWNLLLGRPKSHAEFCW